MPTPRKRASNGAPVWKADRSYVLAGVESMEAKGMTFVVHLKQPQAAFLDLLASPYGPKMTDPAAVAEHKTGSDPWASKWMGSHSAGTGPYMIGDITAGAATNSITTHSTRGAKPHFTSVVFNIIANPATQRLEVESGQLGRELDVVNPRDLESMEGSSKVQVKYFPALYKTAVWVNPTSKSSLPRASARLSGPDSTTRP